MSFFRIPPLAHLAALTLLLAGNAFGAVTSTKFEPAQTVQGTPLTLNGAGTRYRAIFRVYDLALYTSRKVTSAEELLALPGPKRLNFVALRDVPRHRSGRGVHQGFVGQFVTGIDPQAHRIQHAPG